jgi:hypothetical protein
MEQNATKWSRYAVSGFGEMPRDIRAGIIVGLIGTAVLLASWAAIAIPYL